MPRKSPVFYIAPSAISLLPNCNESPNDIEVTMARGAKIVVYSKDTVEMSGGFYQQWTVRGRNRRLADSSKPYTIYARLPKNDKSKGYLVFAPKVQRGASWVDKYNYLLSRGLTSLEGAVTDSTYWYVKMGNVSLPENGKRTITLDTGILGTDYYNATWALAPDELSRLIITCTIDGREAGPTPYVHWDQTLTLQAAMMEGWQDEEVDRVDHWEIIRDSGYPDADADWLQKESVQAFASTGTIPLRHLRDDDDFNGSVSSTFRVKAWGRREDGSEKEIASGSVSILAETVEKYDLSLSTSIVSYDPQTKTYSPEGGVAVRIRATDQRGDTFRLTRQQYQLFGVALSYAQSGSDVWMPMSLEEGEPTDEAVSILPVSVFSEQKGVEVRLTSSEGKELALSTVAFVRDGEDSREREWIFLRSRTAITFGDLTSDHPQPSLIPGGEVSPSGTAHGDDPDKQQDDWVPEGWTDDSMGTDEEFVYEYGSYRDYVHESETVQEAHWGEFSAPRVWSHYGKDAVTYDIIPSVSVITASSSGVITQDGITVRAYRTDGEERSENILPVGDPPQTGSYYYAEYAIDGGQWQLCQGFSYGTDDYGYGIDGLTLQQATESVVFRLKHTDDPNTVLKESLPVNVVKTLSEDDIDGMYLSKREDDEAHGVIGFLAGVWFGIRDWFIDAGGNANLHHLTLKGTFDAIKGYIDDLRSHNFQSGLMDGSGFRLTNDNGEGSSELEVDMLKVRKKATFMNLEVREETFVGGNNHYSPAGSKIYRVEYMTENDESVGYTEMKVPFLLNRFAFLARMFNYAARKRIRRQLTQEEWRTVHHFRCYLLADDGTTATRNWWKVGDQPRCQTFNKAVSAQNKRENTYNWKKDHYNDDPSTPMPTYTTEEGPYETAYYWRLCTNVGAEKLDDGHAYDFIDMPYEGWSGYTEQEKRSFRDGGSGIPVAGDTIVCLGNRYDESRMNCISLYTSGSDNNPPSIKGRRGIHTFSFENTLVWELSPEQFLVRSKNFKLLDDNGYEFAVPLERGEWVKGLRYHWYDRVSWDGCIWLCQVVDVYVWEDAAGNEYQPAQVDDIVIGEGSFSYSQTVGGETYTGTDHYYKRGTVNGQTVYYIRYYTYSEPDKNNDLWLREVDRGRSGIDGDGVEFVYIRTATSEAPYISNSSDTYQEKTYLDDDYLPLSSAGRCTDDPVGPTKELPFEWMAKRCMTDPNSEGKRTWNKYNEGQIGGVMSLWATYSENAVRIDLDNENDTMLYSSAKGLISGSVVTTGSLFDGSKDVSSQATWSILSASGCTATISGRTVTVTAMSAASGSVVVKAVYKTQTYTATLTLKKIVDGDKYDLVITPSAIAYNATTDTPAATVITVQVWRVSADGTRALASPPSGYATYLLDGSAQLMYSDESSFTYTADNSARGDITVKIAKGYASNEYLDCETVPITKAANGQKGDKGDKGNDGTNGKDGAAGHVGRWYYYAGEWNASTQYKFEATKAPYVSVTHNGVSNYFMLDCAAWPSTQQSSSVYTSLGQNPESTAYSDGKPWSTMLAVFKYVISEATFASFAKLGSFIINEDWMISQYGILYTSYNNGVTIDSTNWNREFTIGGKTGLPYTFFNPSSLDGPWVGFAPNFAVDGKTGTSYQNDAHIKGEVVASSGKIGSFTIESDGSMNATSASMKLEGKSGSYDASLVVNGQTQTRGLSVGVGSAWSSTNPYSMIFRGTDFTLPDPETSGIKLGAVIFVKSTKSSGIKVIATSNSRILSGTWEIKQQSDIGGASAFYILSMEKYQSLITGVSAWVWTEFFCP